MQTSKPRKYFYLGTFSFPGSVSLSFSRISVVSNF